MLVWRPSSRARAPDGWQRWAEASRSSWLRPGDDPPDCWLALDAAPSYFDDTLQNDREMRNFLKPRLDRLVFTQLVALGLETVHPQVLPALNKQMTLDDFAQAVDYLLRHDIAVRAFDWNNTRSTATADGRVSAINDRNSSSRARSRCGNASSGGVRMTPQPTARIWFRSRATIP